MDSCLAGNGPAPIRVFILSGHGPVRHALTELLVQEGFDVVGQATTVAAAVPAVQAAAPDIALLGNRLADGTAIEACRSLRDTAPATRCLIMTTYDERKALCSAALADAAGYVLQSPRTLHLTEAIRRAATGRRMHSHAAARGELLTQWTFSRLQGAPSQERAIWSLILTGRTNAQIMAELALPPEAFSAHLSALLARLGYRPAPPPLQPLP